MRAIKFRAWDRENNRFFNPTYEAYKGKLEDLNISLSGDLQMRTLAQHPLHESLFPERFVLNQFTGMLDKNGVEIYEGDILSKEGHWSCYVVFTDGAFRRIPTYPVQAINWEHYPITNDWLRDKGFEVTGNIYEKQEGCPHDRVKFQLQGFLRTCEDCGEVL